jgi:hypothetical protein
MSGRLNRIGFAAMLIGAALFAGSAGASASPEKSHTTTIAPSAAQPAFAPAKAPAGTAPDGRTWVSFHQIGVPGMAADPANSSNGDTACPGTDPCGGP